MDWRNYFLLSSWNTCIFHWCGGFLHSKSSSWMTNSGSYHVRPVQGLTISLSLNTVYLEVETRSHKTVPLPLQMRVAIKVVTWVSD